MLTLRIHTKGYEVDLDDIGPRRVLNMILPEEGKKKRIRLTKMDGTIIRSDVTGFSIVSVSD